MVKQQIFIKIKGNNYSGASPCVVFVAFACIHNGCLTVKKEGFKLGTSTPVRSVLDIQELGGVPVFLPQD